MLLEARADPRLEDVIGDFTIYYLSSPTLRLPLPRLRRHSLAVCVAHARGGGGSGCAPLRAAAQYGHYGTAKALIEAGAAVDQVGTYHPRPTPRPARSPLRGLLVLRARIRRLADAGGGGAAAAAAGARAHGLGHGRVTRARRRG
jgi:hypothetical protein